MAWLPACPALPDPARLRLRLLGGVQGVGLRPAIWRLSQRWPLAGWVRNDGDGACIELEGARADVHAWLAALPAAGGALPATDAPAVDESTVTAPVAGTLTLWQAGDGDRVEAGQVIAVIEAMKMETRVEAHRAGKLSRIAAEGAVLGFDAPIARID